MPAGLVTRNPLWSRQHGPSLLNISNIMKPNSVHNIQEANSNIHSEFFF